jgi:hypothetical protein
MMYTPMATKKRRVVHSSAFLRVGKSRHMPMFANIKIGHLSNQSITHALPNLCNPVVNSTVADSRHCQSVGVVCFVSVKHTTLSTRKLVDSSEGGHLPLIRSQTATPEASTNKSKKSTPAEGSKIHPITAKIPALRIVPRVLSKAKAVTDTVCCYL